MAEVPDDELQLRLQALYAQYESETKIKDGAENLLRMLVQQSQAGITTPESGAQGKDQLRRQVQDELQAAEAKMTMLQQQIDLIIQRMDSQVASTSQERLDHVSPTALGLQQGKYGLLRGYGRGGDALGLQGDSESASSRSHALLLLQTLQSLLPPAPTSTSLTSSTQHSSSTVPGLGLETTTPKRMFSPMGPPITPSTTRSAQRARAAAMAGSKASHVRTPSHAAGLGDVPRRRIDVMSRLVEVLQKSARVRYELPEDEVVACVLPCLADQAGKEVRAAAYRVLRYAMIRPPCRLVRACREAGLDLYLTRTFLRDSRFDIEKEQALKLVRVIMECGYGEDMEEEELMSISIIRALVAAADHGEEKLRHLYIETLAELAVYDIALLYRGGGMRTVLKTMTDGPYELAPPIISLLLSLVDLPGTRRYFRPGYDLEVALSSLTEAREDEESLQCASQTVSVLLRSWSGLLYLSTHNRRAIKSLILALQVNSTKVQDKILDIFCDLLHFSSADYAKKTVESILQKHSTPSVLGSNGNLNLVTSYLAILVITLVDCGLVEAIVQVLETKKELMRKGTLLMGRLTHIAAQHLPHDFGVRVQALPDVFRALFNHSLVDGRTGPEMAKSSMVKEKASRALSAIEKHEAEMLRDRTLLHRQSSESRSRSNSVATNGNTRAAPQVDEMTFRSMLLEANVLNSKDHSKWNVDTLIHLFEAIQGNAKRLEEVMRLSKLVKRVLAFYHPFSLQYAMMASNSRSQRITRLGCIVLQTLITHADGIRFLTDDKLLKEIHDSLDSELMVTTSPQQSHDTLSLGYIEMLGVLSRSEEGRQLMARSHLFTALQRAVEVPGSEDMTRAILQHFDFSTDGHCRVLLSKVLISTSAVVRKQATQTTANMIQVQPSRWLVSQLVTQLYDPIGDIRELASQLLLQICTLSPRALEMVVSMQPMLEETSHALLLKFISTSIGLRYLLQGDYVDREMDEWFNHRNLLYAVQVEVLLARGLNINRQRTEESLQWDGCVPPHFYGELAKTTEGCAVLRQKGHFTEFAHFIRTHGEEDEDVEIICKVKSTLWAVGNIGATMDGLVFLEEEDLVGTIVKISQSSSVLSLRGVCYYVLCLIAMTEQGAELIADEGWTTTSALDEGSYCIPPPAMLHLEEWKVAELPAVLPLPTPHTRLERAIMRQVSNLGNAIVANKASRTLARFKGKHRRLFLTRHRDLFVRSMFIADNHHLRQPVRRFIWELFEIKLDEECVQHILDSKRRLLSSSGNKAMQHHRTLSSTTGGASTSENERRWRQGDEVLGKGPLEEGDDDEEALNDEAMDGSEEDGITDDEGDGDEDEDDSDLDEEGEEEADDRSDLNGIPSEEQQQQQQHCEASANKAHTTHSDGIGDHGRTQTRALNNARDHQSRNHRLLAPILTPERRLVGGFSLTESFADVQS